MYNTSKENEVGMSLDGNGLSNGHFAKAVEKSLQKVLKIL